MDLGRDKFVFGDLFTTATIAVARDFNEIVNYSNM